MEKNKLRKTLGICIIFLFLLSVLPVVEVKSAKNSENHLLKPNESSSLINEITFNLLYGRIIFNGEETHYGYICYNITPINLMVIHFSWDAINDFYYKKGFVKINPIYLQKNEFHGFFGENYMFAWYLNID